ncbi:hypothetical protein [Leifsonia poae]|uniref:Uncharacterized protein n=1 Tax=Leifsonia poae TaxID=110933 RepID=A0A9W6M1G4_9MICO|nr:hypothetical protein [Leifsonia poae]GLJ77699.1 hypothetical protein GCM10017584_32730 [Leifsonia poae]
MSRIFTSTFNPGRARFELVVSPQGDVYAFPLTLAIAQRHVLDGHSRYLVGHVTKGVDARGESAWTASGPSGLVYGTTFPSLSSALEIIADEYDLTPVP